MKLTAFVGASLVLAAAALPPAAAAADVKTPAVKLEAMPGSPAKRVILTARAAQRLGIETAKVGIQAVSRKQMVSGLVVAAAEAPSEARQANGGAANPFQVAAARPQAQAQPKAIASGDALLRVMLSPAEWERLAKDKPARVLPLATREQGSTELVARPSGMPPQEDTKRSMLAVHYVLAGKDHGQAMNKRMRVELPLEGGETQQKVVPYGAVYYDAKGAAWLYVVTQPLTYERRRIEVERVVAEMAVLSQGPEVGTPVVSVGAALLFGAEIFGK